MGKYFTYEERLKLKELLDLGCSKGEIASRLNKSVKTIYNELHRNGENKKYDPDYAQADADKASEIKRRPPILENKELAEYIANLILEKKYSPETIVNILKDNKKFSGMISSYKTIYNGIYSGMIPGVTKESLRSNETTMFSGGLLRLPNWAKEEFGYADGDRFEMELTEDTIIFRKVK